MENTEFENIKDKFKRVISYSQGITNPCVDDLFDKWLDAKHDFIDLMGGKLIYELPNKVSFELDNKAKQSLLSDFIERVEHYYGNYKLSNYISEMEDSFFCNSVQRDYELYDDEDEVIEVIPKGMKFVKSFKFFEDNLQSLDKIQQEASMIIQKDKLEGTLCFSVHPLDFLSSSENQHNWRSCHALDGEYRAGNLSYMVDKSTVMIYLKSDKDAFLPNFPNDVPWNNKKWRMLLFFSENWQMLFAGRQYPFVSSNAPYIIINELLPAISNKIGMFEEWFSGKVHSVPEKMGRWTESHHLKHTYIPIKGDLYRLDKIVIDGDHAMNFNDLLRSSCYDPIYSIADSCWRFDDSSKGFTFTIGGPVPCLCCGKEYINISETMRCVPCEEKYGEEDSEYFSYCACCGRRFYTDDATWVGDEVVCPTCRDNGEVVQCTTCGDWFFKDDIKYDDVTDTENCRWCYDDILYNRGESV